MADTQLRSKTVAPLPIAGFDAINHNINTMDIQSAENLISWMFHQLKIKKTGCSIN